MLMGLVSAQQAGAATGVSLVSSSQWGPDAIGDIHVVGEVVNSGTSNASLIEIAFDFFSASNTLLKTDFTFTTVDALAPGEKSPFEDIFTPPAGYDHYVITSINPSSPRSIPNHNFSTTVTNVFVDSIGAQHIVGQVTNNNTTTSDFVEVVFTFYDGTGRTVGTDFTFVNTGSTSALGAGQTASFEEIVSPGQPGYVTRALLTQSTTAPTTPGAPPPGSAASGYWFVASDGGVFSFGNHAFFGSTGGIPINKPIVAIAATPSGNGYWLVASDGGIFTFGDAAFFGSTGGLPLNRPIVGMTATPTGRGYWLVASDGGIFTFGDARFLGSTGGLPLNQPVVGMAPTPDGKGYWLVARDGGIFSFGSAVFYGSTGGIPLNRPIVGMAPTPDGRGYSFVASDGGIFTFGTAGFFGSTGGVPLNKPVVGMAATTTGAGYWLVATDGGIFTFGDAGFFGSTGGVPLNKPIVAVAS